MEFETGQNKFWGGKQLAGISFRILSYIVKNV